VDSHRLPVHRSRMVAIDRSVAGQSSYRDEEHTVAEPPTPAAGSPSPGKSPQAGTAVPPAQAGSKPRAGDPWLVRLAAPSPRGVIRTILIVAACGIALYLVWRIRLVLRLVGISLFFALALVPLVDAIAGKIRVPRAMIILIVYMVLIAGVILVGYVVVPSLVKEVHQLSNDAPAYAGDLRHNATFRHYDNRYHITSKLVQDARRLPQLLGHLVGPLKDVTVQAFSLIAQLTTVLAIAFLLVLHGREYVNMGLSLTGPRRARYRQLIIEINKAVADYMLGNIAISVLATLATWIVLSILGVPYALSLGLVVGFFDLIPLVGATLGAIFVALATLTVSFPAATIVWVVFIIVWQRFEDYVVQPLVYRRALRVNPIVTIVSVLAGATLLGILGALLAIPTAAAIQIVLRAWWANRTHEELAPASTSTVVE
jgi:predicted PurR-regulated permease PerM